jgi:AAA+ superfamily predicted ATPase
MAFSEIKTYTDQLRKPDGLYTSACILLIDEADALAQSREFLQMQHEDRAGVDALIQGVDAFMKQHIPVVTVMCTNRLVAMDPAIRRRAAAIFEFSRPTEEQRLRIFQNYLDGTGISPEELQMFAELTGKNGDRDYGYTYSDIIQNVLPALVLETFPTEQITKDRIIRIIGEMPPTPPFNELRPGPVKQL